MFNSNKASNKVSNTTNQSPSVNIISEGTKLKGNIHSNSDIRISGTIIGEAVSKGKMIITNEGEVKGNITSSDADIAGRVEGDVRVNSKLVLRKNSVIDGNIFTKSLIVEEGAQINGTCKMGADLKSITQNNDAEYAEETKLKSAK
ncbi:bactofilin family protein [Balneola vulgaris]|jgi:cytoskeletal protein CcmA (bactofilin family)|uniref:bactofilin family protein n=1 Tax=Balneola vulgaris TaxID=287535 RepID=UPI000376CD87|nr:polymer-forming cytoskeletal protein [Balneola vulgaris]